MKINLTDKYKTRSGHPVTVYAVDLRNNTYSVLAVIHHQDFDSICRYKDNGKVNDNYDDEKDLIKVTPYDHIKIDDKVFVWDNDNEDTPARAYFAGVNQDGKPLTFAAGKTSWTNADEKLIIWDNCEKFDE